MHAIIIPRRALSNTERQRLFRQNNPGYYARLQAKRRAMSDERVRQIEAERRAAAQEKAAAAG